MGRGRRSRRGSTRLLEVLGKLCYVGALGMVLLLIAAIVPKGGGGDDTKTGPESAAPRTTERPPTTTVPAAVDPNFPGIASAAAGNEAAIIDTGTFGGPIIVMPQFARVARRGESPVTELSVRFTDAQTTGKTVGVILYAPDGGSIALQDPAGCRLWNSNGTPWLPVTGTVEQLNAALSTMVYQATGDIGNRIEVIFGDLKTAPAPQRATHRVLELRPQE